MILAMVLIQIGLAIFGFACWRDARKWQESWYRAEVQLAGCLMAAEGVGMEQAAKKGDYGWTLAYQKTLDLRCAYNSLHASTELVREEN